jgi:hypothetical protein
LVKNKYFIYKYFGIIIMILELFKNIFIYIFK